MAFKKNTKYTFFVVGAGVYCEFFYLLESSTCSTHFGTPNYNTYTLRIFFLKSTCVTCINHSGPPNPPRYCAQTVRKGAQEPIQMSQRDRNFLAALWAIHNSCAW